MFVAKKRHVFQFPAPRPRSSAHYSFSSNNITKLCPAPAANSPASALAAERVSKDKAELLVTVILMAELGNEEPIYNLACECRNLFSRRVPDDPPAVTNTLIEDYEQRFLSWSAYMGVFADKSICLDRRLGERLDIRDLVLRLLDVLEEALRQLICEHEQSPQGQVLPMDLDPTDLQRDSIDGVLESNEDEKHDNCKSNGDKTDDISEMDDLMEDIETSLTRLFHLGTTIRKYSSTSRTARINKFAEQSDLGEFEKFARMVVKTLYTDANDGLQAQLTRSMVETCASVLYKRSHQNKINTPRSIGDYSMPIIAEETEPTAFNTSISMKSLTTEAPPCPVPPKLPRSTSQPKSYALTESAPSILDSIPSRKIYKLLRPGPPSGGSISSIQLGKVRYPRPPKTQDSSSYRSCEWCLGRYHQGLFEDTKKWSAHIDQDFEPYVCLSEDCLNERKLPCYPTFREWFEHMNTAHTNSWQREIHKPIAWVCSFNHPAAYFDTVEELHDHMIECYPEVYAASLEVIAKNSYVKRSRLRQICPICCRDSIQDVDKRTKASSRTVDSKRRKAQDAQGNIRNQSVSEVDEESSDDQEETELSDTFMARHIAEHLQILMFLTIRLIKCHFEGESFVEIGESCAASTGDSSTRSSGLPLSQPASNIDSNETFDEYQERGDGLTSSHQKLKYSSTVDDNITADYHEIRKTELLMSEDINFIIPFHMPFSKNRISVNIEDELREADKYFAELRSTDIPSMFAARQAVAATSEDDIYLSRCLENLSNGYSFRFERLGNQEDLEKAIEIAQRAIAATPEDSPDLAGYLNNLSKCYSSRFERLGNQEDLEKAIEAAQKAISTTFEDDPDAAGYFNDLSIYYHSKFDRLGMSKDLERAMEYAQQAVAATSENSLNKAACLNNLSNCYSSRFDEYGSREDLAKAIIYTKDAFSTLYVSLLSKVRIWKRLSLLYYLFGDRTRAANTAADAIFLLPWVSPRYNPRHDQEHTISQASVLSSLACSLALQAGRPAIEAFGLIEIGRAVTASLAIDLQTDVFALREFYPELYERYETLRYQFSVVSSGEFDVLPESKTPKSHRDKSSHIERELTRVEDEIRMMPGFAGFQLPPRPEELKEMAKEGPLVAFNISDIRSDALIITNTEIKALNLEYLDYAEAVRRMSGMSQISNRHPQVLYKNNERMAELLKWLWLVAVKPVFEELGFLERATLPKGPELPRIWWVTGGVMGPAPLHVAGIYNGLDEKLPMESAIDFAISSYISTAKALKFARDRLQRQVTEVQGEALLISAHDDDLDFEGEIRSIEGVIERHFRTVRLRNGSKEEALRHIEQSSIVHFSCHGISVGFEPSSEPPKSPSDSFLLLAGSLESLDDPAEKLTVDDLVKIKHPRAQLAFLAACSTAGISAEKLKDEMIHIANTFQLAGYPHVVGTLWQADDEAATFISKAFYENLLRDGPQNLRYGVATALHQAIRELMQDDEFKEDFLAWAPFIHIGA
ncbi:hypothetical protein TWF718_000451 [Orbilia javanica]|uniref:CHAT domain-containing protein n=1 Tax=Orbilia javanica TaxID=47235 RepID=A0AAN8MTX6_9PEZI